MVKYYSSLLERILQEQASPQVSKMITSFIALHFKRGKLKEEAAIKVVGKVDEVVSNATVRDTLLENRKQYLVDLVKSLKMTLENREHFRTVSWAIGSKNLESKLWDYSDCTNYMYEKELIGLRKMLGTEDL